MKYGLELEPAIIDRYKTEKANDGDDINATKLGLIVDADHGFLATSPDGGVEENGSILGIVECKTAVKWSQKTVSECITSTGYPLQIVKRDVNRTTVTKKSA